MPRAGAGGPLAPDDPLRLAGTYQLIAINGAAPPRDVGLLDRFPPFGSCDLTLDGATLVLTGGNAGAGGYTLDVQGRRTNCTDGSGKPFTGASLNGGEAGPWSVNGTLTFTNVAGSEYQITRASYGAFVIVLDVTAWAHSNGGPFHLVLAFAKT